MASGGNTHRSEGGLKLLMNSDLRQEPGLKAGRFRAMRVRQFAKIGILLALLGSLPGCFLYHHNDEDISSLMAGQQPDKLLYQKSLSEIDKGRYDVGRLTLQALLNTYPDSEYLAKAKLAIADSYFEQGGTSGLTQAEAEYKDFITFFPTAPEAPMAQYRVGMAHFRLMGKPGRDLTQAREAETAFKEFLLKYSDSSLMPRAKARLREVQEVLATGDYKVARFYYEKHAKLAARSRFEEIVDNYPSFSKADHASWYLAETYRQLSNPKLAARYYDRIIVDYPLSTMVPDAKRELAELHQPIPQPTMATLARARADAHRRTHESLLGKFTGTFSSSPDMSATRHGPVIITPPQSTVEMAKNGEPTTTPGTEVSVQQVSNSTLKNGTPAQASDPKDKESKDPPDSNASGKASVEAGRNDQNASSKKKSGHLHFFKKVLKPF